MDACFGNVLEYVVVEKLGQKSRAGREVMAAILVHKGDILK